MAAIGSPGSDKKAMGVHRRAWLNNVKISKMPATDVRPCAVWASLYHGVEVREDPRWVAGSTLKACRLDACR